MEKLKREKISKIEIAILCAFLVTVILSLFGVSTFALDKKLNNIRDKVFRLHILANSDSSEDQALKLKVRDAILKENNEIFKPQSKEDAISVCEQNLDEIKKIAEKEIEKNGYSYKVNAYIDNRYFNTRHYENVTMPAGYYDSLVVEIGKAQGKNWWCVMFPALCVPSCTDDKSTLDYNKEELNTALQDDETDMLTNNKYKFRFKSVEIFNNIKNKIGKIF